MLSKRILVLMFLLVFLPLVGCFPAPTNQAPILTSDPIKTATVGVLYTYNVNAIDPDDDTLTYSLSVKPSGMIINSVTGVIFWTPTAKGDYPVTVKVSDGSLSITQPFTIKVSKPTPTPINHAPVIYSTPITTATVGVTYFYDVNATDQDGDTLTYLLTTSPSGMAINLANGLIWWTPTAKGNYAVVVKVSDGALVDTQGFTIVVSKPSVPPEIYTITASAGSGGSISPLGDVTVNKGSNRVFTITPNALYDIEKVLVDGVSVGAVSAYTFNNVAKDHTIHATFSAIEVMLIGIKVVPKVMTLFVGETEDIVSVTAHYNDGSTFVIDQLGYDYGNGSDDISVATVDVNHVVTAVAKGTATITVMYEDKTDTIAVTVNPVLLDHIIVEPKPMTLFVGEIEFFKVIAHYNFGPTKNVTYDCVYVSNDPTIAKILLISPNDYQKSVKAVGEGIAKITATYKGMKDTLVITVNPVPPNDDATLRDLTVDGDTIVNFNSSTYTYNVGLPYGTTAIPIVRATSTDSNASKVITQAGSVTGTATVLVTAEDNSTQLTYTVTFTVSPLAVGDSYKGGIVAYILQSEDPGYFAGETHGLIAATEDQSTGIRWYNGSTIVTGATGFAIGTGQANTAAIVTAQGTGDYAAQLCDDLTEGGCSDWFLPSLDELNKLFINKAAIGGFDGIIYWSSSEDLGQSSHNAWSQKFDYGNTDFHHKSMPYYVRAVRAF